jgi:hypothetical protein
MNSGDGQRTIPKYWISISPFCHMGTLLLSEIPEPSPGIRESFLECDQLGFRQWALRGCGEGMIDLLMTEQAG